MTKHEHDRIISRLEQAIMLSRCHEDRVICEAMILIIHELYDAKSDEMEDL